MSLSSISVIIPVYQSAERLPVHVESLRKLRSQVHEFIWMITKSPDGSHITAGEAAKELGGQVLEVPRGLYQAWNAGIARATGNFVYISTIGDTITPEGLSALTVCMLKNQADVVFSPPIISPATRTNLKRSRHWPVFAFSKFLNRFAGLRIPKEKVLLLQILSGASGLLGSCASCLFNTFYLQTNLFPTQYYHYGDTAWTYLNLPNIVLAFHPDPVARFFVHDHEKRRVVNKKQIYSLINKAASQLRPPLSTHIGQYIEASLKIDKIRDPHPKFGWWWMPAAWIARSQRNKSKRALIQALQQF